MPITKDKKNIFVHIPKCAGYSIEKAMGIEHRKYSANDFSFNILFGKELQHLSLIEIDNISSSLINDIPKVFSVIRDPAERLRSEFLWSLPWRDINDFCENYVFPGLKKYTYDLAYRHLGPQYYFLLPGRKLKVDKIYLISEIKDINKDFDFGPIPHANIGAISNKHNLPPLEEFEKITREHYPLDHRFYDTCKDSPLQDRGEVLDNLKQETGIVENKKKNDDNISSLCETCGFIFNNMNFVTQGLWDPKYEEYVKLFVDLEKNKGLEKLKNQCDIEKFILNCSKDSRRNLIMLNALKTDKKLWYLLCKVLAKDSNLPDSLMMKY